MLWPLPHTQSNRILKEKNHQLYSNVGLHNVVLSIFVKISICDLYLWTLTCTHDYSTIIYILILMIIKISNLEFSFIPTWDIWCYIICLVGRFLVVLLLSCSILPIRSCLASLVVCFVCWGDMARWCGGCGGAGELGSSPSPARPPSVCHSSSQTISPLLSTAQYSRAQYKSCWR